MIRFAFALLCVLLLPVNGLGAETLRIVNLDIPPFAYVEKGKSVGMAYDMANMIAEEAGLEPVNRLVRVRRGVEELAQGRADIIIMLPNESVEAVADNLGSIVPIETVILGRRGVVYNSLDDLRGKTLAAVRGAKYDKRMTNSCGIIFEPIQSYLHGLKLLLGGCVDAVAGPACGLEFAIKTHDLPREDLGEPLVLDVAQGSVYLSKKSRPGLADRLRCAIERLKATGAVDRLWAKYTL